ncbi:GntR family transcriptional regulator [Allokutzneria oryzae]|uniref:GntR family transcriptional regulator n=1 Tax=Allokutzneria oryzae TaxID=1378989 RepID=A0ABV5ZUP1_9PSEU
MVAFAADREASGREWKPGDQTNTVGKTTADAEIAEVLGVEEGSEVYERSRLVKDGETPTHTLTSYYRPEHVEGTPLVDPTPGPAGRGGGFAVLTMRGLEPDAITETVFARMPSPDEIELLKLPAGEPVMVLKRRTVTKDGVPVEFARGVHAASRFAWSYNFPIPD